MTRTTQALIRNANPAPGDALRGAKSEPGAARALQSILNSTPATSLAVSAVPKRRPSRLALASIAAVLIAITAIAVVVTRTGHRPSDAAGTPEEYLSSVIGQILLPDDVRPSSPFQGDHALQLPSSQPGDTVRIVYWTSARSVSEVSALQTVRLSQDWTLAESYEASTVTLQVFVVRDPASPFAAQVSIRLESTAKGTEITALVAARLAPVRSAAQVIPEGARAGRVDAAVFRDGRTQHRTQALRASQARAIAVLVNGALTAVPYGMGGKHPPCLGGVAEFVLHGGSRSYVLDYVPGCRQSISLRVGSLPPLALDGNGALATTLSRVVDGIR